MFKFFLGKKREASQDLTLKGGLICFFGLEKWYEFLSDEEKIELINASIKNNEVCIGEKLNNLLRGEITSNQKKDASFGLPTAWLRILFLRTDNKSLKEKIQKKIEAWDKNVDWYFQQGQAAKDLWGNGEEEKSFEEARKQLDWYREEGNRRDLRFSLFGVLPKQILGLDIMVRFFKKQGNKEEAQKLKEEFIQIMES